MRTAAWLAVFGCGWMLALWGAMSRPATVHAQRPPIAMGPVSASGPVNLPGRFEASGDLIAISFDVGGGRQQLTLVDPRTRMVGVYHIDPATGELTLKSVRNVHWDLQMDEFNGTNPSPREIRSLLGNKAAP
jgi:hypothetical protein